MWLVPQDEFQSIIATADSYNDVLRALGYQTRGCNINTLKRRIEADGLSVAHFTHRGLRPTPHGRLTPEQVFVCPSPHRQSTLRRMLRKCGLFPDQCQECGQPNVYNGKPLVLQVDHINGNPQDDRLANLRILCPNCHTQTPTWGGRGFHRSVAPAHKPCVVCGKPASVASASGMCLLCSHQSKRVPRPNPKELLEMLANMSMEAVGRQYGVTGAAVKKWKKEDEKTVM